MDSDNDDREINRPITARGNTMNSKVMLGFMILLVIIIVVVLFYRIHHMYKRCLLRREARRRAGLVGLYTTAYVNPNHKQPSGSMTIAPLSTLEFKQTGMGATECSVCLSVSEDGEMVRVLPNCNHAFHTDCIDKWFSTYSTCPTCSVKAEPQRLPEPLQPPATAGV